MRVAVVPALDEGRAIGSIVLKARRHVDRVIVVDDGSKDDTAEVARLAGADVILHDKNRGKGAAVRSGLESAIGTGGRFIVVLDGDGQHDPDSIPVLLRPLEEGDADFVVGSRSMNGNGRASRGRKIGRRILDRTTNLAGGGKVADTQSGYRAFRAETVERILPRERSMGMESEMLLHAVRSGQRVVEVPIQEHYPADVRPHLHPVRHGKNVIDSVLRFVREEHPLALFGGLGILLIAWGMWSGYQTATHYYATNEFWPGKAMISMLTLTLGTIGLLGGMILDYLNLRLPRR